MTPRSKPYNYGDKVAVYYNLRRKCLSVCDASRGKQRKLLGHTDKINLKRVDFKVSKSGQAKVRKEKRKNVHALVVGIVCRAIPVRDQMYEELKYNPYKHEGFTDPDGVVRKGDFYVKIIGNRVLVPAGFTNKVWNRIYRKDGMV